MFRIGLAKLTLPQAFSDMAAIKESESLDGKFYKPADAFFPAYSNIGLTFDDVTLATLYSEVLPRETQLDTILADNLHLNIPIISSDMDTVTESRLAIAMALNGGLGLIHYNMPERLQLSELSRVKNNVHGLIQEPIKASPEQSIGDVLKLIDEKHFAFSTFPVVDGGVPVSEQLAEEVISLPMHAYLDTATQDLIVEAVRRALEA